MADQPQYKVEQASFELSAGRLADGRDLSIRGEVKVRREARGDAEPPAALPAAVVCHGFKGFKDWGFFPYLTDRLAEAGFYTVSFNFSCSGVGETDFDRLDLFAVNTYSREQEDLAAVVSHLRQGMLPLAGSADPQRISLLGHSRGGGNVILFAAEHEEIGRVVTWNGIANPDLFGDDFRAEAMASGAAYVPNARTGQQMPISAVFFEDLDANRERFDVASQLSRLTIPVLQLQGDQDSPRLRAGFEQLRAQAPQHQAMTIEGGTHTFGAVHPFGGTTPQLEQALQLTIEFLQSP